MTIVQQSESTEIPSDVTDLHPFILAAPYFGQILHYIHEDDRKLNRPRPLLKKESAVRALLTLYCVEPAAFRVAGDLNELDLKTILHSMDRIREMAYMPFGKTDHDDLVFVWSLVQTAFRNIIGIRFFKRIGLEGCISGARPNSQVMLLARAFTYMALAICVHR
ncbi:MAG: hypothetical protein ABII13_00325 [Patescibacteria group bacterium]|nr:hypothetical protein [Patescibacteria group bacterium]MBU2508818.1 hypothetical protein [Patescibacteria group bacterium]